MTNRDMILGLICVLVISWLILITVLVYLFTVRKALKQSKQQQDQDVDLERVKILLQDNAVNKIDEVLDTYINNAASIYQVLEIAKSQKEYLNNDDIERMISYVSTMVLKNMTPESISLLSLTHVFNDNNDIIDLIKLRTKLYVLNFSIEFNVIKE